METIINTNDKLQINTKSLRKLHFRNNFIIWKSSKKRKNLIPITYVISLNG